MEAGEEKGGKGEVVQEDVCIYRIIVNAEVLSADNARSGIHSEIANLSAFLSICDSILQKEIIFTEAMIILDRGILTIPAGEAARARSPDRSQGQGIKRVDHGRPISFSDIITVSHIMTAGHSATRLAATAGTGRTPHRLSAFSSSAGSDQVSI